MTTRRVLRTLAGSGLAAVSLAASVAFAPAATTDTLTDVAGDARGQYLNLTTRNAPTVDLLRVDLTRDATSVATAIRLGDAASRPADSYGVSVVPTAQNPDPDLNEVFFGVGITGGEATLTVYFGDPTYLDNGTVVVDTINATPVVDLDTDTVRASFSRARVDAAVESVRGTPLSTTEQLRVTADSAGRAPGITGATAYDSAS